MKKRIMRRLTVMTLAVVCGCVSVGCGLFGGKKEDTTVYDISTAAEFRAMEEGKNYRLTADIDLGNLEWETPIKLKSLDGGGHTVKNAFVMRDSEYYHAGFFRRAESLRDVTFENLQLYITVTDNKSTGDSFSFQAALGIVAGEVDHAENVTVKDCSAEYTVSRLFDDVHAGCLGGLCFDTGELKNCTVENCSLEVTAQDDYRIQLGGLLGVNRSGAAVIENCTVTGTTLKAATDSGISAGGLIGEYGAQTKSGNTNGKGAIRRSVVKGCTLELKAGAEEELTRAGGFMGQSTANGAAIENCAAVENTVTAETGYCYNVGGFAGKSAAAIRNCLGDGNTLTCSTSLAQDNKTEFVGGFCGSSQGTISRCIAQNNVVKGTDKTYSGMKAAGFIVSGTSVARSGVYNNTVTGGNVDAFACAADSVNVCGMYIEEGTVSPCAYEVELMLSEEWANAIDTLELDADCWQFVGGKLTLKILAA